MKLRVAVGVSGGGRTLENLRARADVYEVVAVIASKSECRGAQLALEWKLPLFVDSFAVGATDVSQRLQQWLVSRDVQLVALGGFIKRFPSLEGWEQRIVNMHPALLPEFGGQGMYGDRVHAAVLAAGARESGATVHFVNAAYDEGQIIARTRVPVNTGDDVKTLAARVFAAECVLYPQVLRGLATRSLPLAAGRVWEG